MTIESIKKSERVADRFYITSDSGERLSVTTAQIADYSLYSGRELTDEEACALRGDAKLDAAKARALRIIGERMMSRHDVVSRLVRHGDSQQTADAAADWLEKIGVLNDAEYAAALVRHYSKKGYGAAKLRDELYKHGVERDMWEEALQDMPDSRETAYNVLSSRLKDWDGDTIKLKKATDMLMRRGFSWDDVKQAAEKIKSEIKD